MSQSYAVIPAAGTSRRMGQPKLLLPWGDWTLIDQVLQAWISSGVDQVVVVVRGDDQPLRAACGRWPVHLVKPLQAPRDMKESVCFGLQFLQEHWQPAADDRCFVAPADVPRLTAPLIDSLLEIECNPDTVIVPHFGDRQGHPVLLPWSLTQQIHDLAADQGVNEVVRQNPQHVVSLAADEYFGDVDTPQQYEQLRGDCEDP